MMYGYGFRPNNRLFSGGGGGDADASAFITTASITDSTQQSAINQLVLDLKSYSIWSKMYAIYPFVGGNALSHSYNLKDTSTFQITWNGGITHDSNGVISNGVNGLGQTGFNPTTESVNQDSWAFGLYSRTNNTTQSFDMGSVSGVRSEIDLYNSGRYIVSNNCSFVSTNILSRTDGFFINSRISSTDFQFFRNGALFQSIATASTGLNNSNLQVLSAQGFGTPSTKQNAFSFLSQGLDATESANFNTAVQAYQTTLLRNV